MGAEEAKPKGGDKSDHDKEKDNVTNAATKTNEEEQDVDTLTSQLKDLQVAPPTKRETPESLKKVAHLIQSGKAKHILVLSGAGVSCSAGIPDFRTPGTGLYDNLAKYNLPYPEAVFDLDFYRSNPWPFLNLAKELWPGLQHSPTLTHSFISLLHKKQVLLRNYSQNIDGLESLANVPHEKLVECHGHFSTASCIECGFESHNCKQTILSEENEIPTCYQCGGYVKPDIVFFGEDLPRKYHAHLRGDVYKADLLLVMGTSLQVAPVSLIPDWVDCPRVLMNRERVGNFHSKRGDLIFTGDCDEAVLLLARDLGWEKELLELNESTKIVPKKQERKGESADNKEDEKKKSEEDAKAAGKEE